jgi:hypothetical protein
MGYRRPDEEQAQSQHEAEVREVLDQAVHDGASCMTAMLLGEPADVVNRWSDAVWDGLRDNLSDDRPSRAGQKIEDRLTAIVMLLTDRMRAEAAEILAGVEVAR